MRRHLQTARIRRRADSFRRRLAAAGLGALMLLAGCVHVESLQSAAPIGWTGLGARLTLPPGSWKVRPTPTAEIVMFARDGDPHRYALIRGTSQGEPADVVLRTLLVYFEEKRLLSSSSVVLPSGVRSEVAEYAVKTEGHEVTVRLAVVPAGRFFHALVCWPLDDPNGVVTKTADSLLQSLAATGAPERQGGAP